MSQRPVLTIAGMVASIVLFIGINLEPTPLSWESYAAWGAPGPDDLFGGSWWGLLTSNLLHVEAWHIAFNLYWFWIFNSKIEAERSRLFCAFLLVSAALVSSSAQLAGSDGTGIGLSGVVYALMGYITIAARTDPRFGNVISKKLVQLFMGWLVLCIVLTGLDIFPVGNGAHVGGLLWGVLLAWLGERGRAVRWVSAAAVLGVVSSSIFWSPLSTGWLSHKALRAHTAGDLDAAMTAYRQILSRDPANEFARDNLELLEAYQRELMDPGVR